MRMSRTAMKMLAKSSSGSSLTGQTDIREYMMKRLRSDRGEQQEKTWGVKSVDGWTRP